MVDQLETFRRRSDRERRARKAAEQIAETKSRELFLKSQEIECALSAERSARKETETLLTALEKFTSYLEPAEILACLERFTGDAFPDAVAIIRCKLGGDLVILEDVPDGESLTPRQVVPGFLVPDPVADMFKSPTTFTELATEHSLDERLTILDLRESTRSLMVLPIRVEGCGLGYMTVESSEESAFDEKSLRFAGVLVRQAAGALNQARLFREVERLSQTDPLTELHNRRYLDAAAERLLGLAKRHERPLSVLMLDVDHFKHVNDTHGHAAGDVVLVGLAKLCISEARVTDLCARLGGEEFCMVLPETDAHGAFEAAERLRVRIAELSFPGAVPFSVTISIGVAELAGNDETFSVLLERADRALYRAKEGGRNQVIIS